MSSGLGHLLKLGGGRVHALAHPLRDPVRDRALRAEARGCLRARLAELLQRLLGPAAFVGDCLRKRRLALACGLELLVGFLLRLAPCAALLGDVALLRAQRGEGLAHARAGRCVGMPEQLDLPLKLRCPLR